MVERVEYLLLTNCVLLVLVVVVHPHQPVLPSRSKILLIEKAVGTDLALSSEGERFLSKTVIDSSLRDSIGKLHGRVRESMPEQFLESQS